MGVFDQFTFQLSKPPLLSLRSLIDVSGMSMLSRTISAFDGLYVQSGVKYQQYQKWGPRACKQFHSTPSPLFLHHKLSLPPFCIIITVVVLSPRYASA